MTERNSSAASSALPLLLIAVVVIVLAAAFGWAAGWFSPHRLSPAKLVDSLAPPDGPALGFRRNHAKGICFTGTFESSGAGAGLSKAPMLAAGSFPVVGRFNLASADPKAADTAVPVRGVGLRISAPDGSEWRAAMIDAPFFAVSTPQAFYAAQLALRDKDDPDAMKKFIGAHPEFGAFAGWVSHKPLTRSYAQDQYNGLNSFLFTNAGGESRAVRFSLVPLAARETLTADALDGLPADFLATDIVDRVRQGPQRWTLQLVVANPGDPTADPSKAWPADRRKVDAGTLVVDAIEPEADGPCRDLNFDPTVLPPGMTVSDDPFPAARSAAYSVSFNRRTAEDSHYPHTVAGAGARP